MSGWKRVLASNLRDELKRLQGGNKKEIQRYKNAMGAIATVMGDPALPKYIKSNVGHYRAADVLAQYRLFFEILDEQKVIHFVWMNDDQYIHDNSKKPDPCYERFRHLIEHKKLEKYMPPEEVKTGFELHGVWRQSAAIYASFTDDRGVARSYLNMQGDDRGCYKITSIRAEVEGTGLELALLKEVVVDAGKNGVSLYFELDLTGDQVMVKTMRAVFAECGFTAMDDGEIELWEWSPSV